MGTADPAFVLVGAPAWEPGGGGQMGNPSLRILCGLPWVISGSGGAEGWP